MPSQLNLALFLPYSYIKLNVIVLQWGGDCARYFNVIYFYIFHHQHLLAFILANIYLTG